MAASYVFINLKIKNKPKKLIGIILKKFLLQKKIKNKPIKNSIQTEIMTNKDLKKNFFSNIKKIKNIEKKENLCIKPPAINSSPKKLELKNPIFLRPAKLKPKIY